MIKIVGKIPKLTRVQFGLWSFDLAFANRVGDIGYPIGTVAEISGASSVGKSTTTYSIAGYLAAQLKKDISLVDLEGFDPDFLLTVLEGAGFDGTINYIQDAEDEKALDELLESLKDKKKGYGIGIVDSVGAISPIAEAEGDLGEANMGRRAKLVTAFLRKSMKIRRDNSTSIFLINHQLPNIGSRGVNTPGGEGIKYLSAVRIRMSRKEEFQDGSYVIEGKVLKNRFGYRERTFHLVNLIGKGIHWGLTWMFDGFLNGTVERGRGSAGIRINGTRVCGMKDAFMTAYEGNDEFFLPFKEAVYSAKEEIKEGIEDDEPANTETDDTPADPD